MVSAPCTLSDGEQEFQRAEVTVLDPTVASLHRRQNLIRQSPLLSVTVLAREDIYHQFQRWI